MPALLALVKARRVTVVGCYDPDDRAAANTAQRLGAQLHAPVVAADTLDSDAVLVATPPDKHFEIVSTCLRAGCHVLVEKPFAVMISQAEALTGESSTGGRSLCVGHFRRFLPSVNSARELIQTGMLGPIISVVASEGARWEWGAMSRYFVEDPAGGVVFDTGAHVLDSVLYILGLDSLGNSLEFEVGDLSKNPPEEPSQEMRARFMLRPTTSNPIEVYFHVSRRQSLANVIHVRCERGALDVIHSPRDACFIRIRGNRMLVNQVIPQTPVDTKGCLALEYDDFLASCTEAGFTSRLDGQNFVALTKLLQGLAAGRPRPVER